MNNTEDSSKPGNTSSVGNFIDRWLVTACVEGDLSWDSDPVATVNFVKEINTKYGWNISTDMDDIKNKLKRTDERIKKMSLFYQKLQNDPAAEDRDCEKKSGKRKRNGSISSLSTLGTSTSYSQTQTSDITDVDENIPVQETMAADDHHEFLATANQILVPQEASEPSDLFIRRELNASDMDKLQNRLSMPCKQSNDGILTVEEKQILQKKLHVAAKLTDPRKKTYHIYLKKVNSGLSSYSYAIGKPWNEIKEENGFQKGTVLEIRVCRGKEGELCFLVERILN